MHLPCTYEKTGFRRFFCNTLIYMVGGTGIEPVTLAV